MKKAITREVSLNSKKSLPFKLHHLYWLIILAATAAIILFSYNVARHLTRTALDASQRVAAEVNSTMQQQALDATHEKLVLSAKSKTSQAQTLLNQAMGVITTLAQALSGMKAQGVVVDVGRDTVNSMLQSLLHSQSEFFAVYTIWEPDRFDMLDLAYADAPAHDNSGRFASYWYRAADNSLKHRVAGDYNNRRLDDNGVMAGAYYLLPRRDGIPHVIDPQQRIIDGRPIWLISTGGAHHRR